MIQWIAERLAERSTWTGLLSIAAAAGLAFNPDEAEAIVAAGLGLGGLIWAFTKD